MPTTAQNITTIQRRVPDYSRPQILTAMNDFYEEVYSVETEQTLYIDPATGMAPFIATTAGQYQYNCPATCRRVDAVFSLTLPRVYDRTRPVTPRREYYYRSRGYHTIAVTSRDAQPDGSVATVTFLRDPGTTTNRFYLSYYLLVVPLVVEADEMIIPSWTHREFRRGVIASLRAEDYGETGNENAIVKDVLKYVRGQLNRGEQGTTGQTPIQPEYQDNTSRYGETQI